MAGPMEKLNLVQHLTQLTAGHFTEVFQLSIKRTATFSCFLLFDGFHIIYLNAYLFIYLAFFVLFRYTDHCVEHVAALPFFNSSIK